jgi:hypothetical protein
MAIWTLSSKFNADTDVSHQLPQTTGDGNHSLLQEVVLDVSVYLLHDFIAFRLVCYHIDAEVAQKGT